VGQDVINFSPATFHDGIDTSAFHARDQHPSSTSAQLQTRTVETFHGSTSNSTRRRNSTTLGSTTITVSVPGPTQTMSPDVSGLLAELLKTEENDVQAFLGYIIGNITADLQSGLGNGQLGTIFQNQFRNFTTNLGEAISDGVESFFQDILQRLDTGGLGSLQTSTMNSGLNTFIQEALSNFTAGVATGLSEAESAAAQGITKVLGVQQLYALHLRNVCTGVLSSPSDPQASFTITGCLTYSEAASSRSPSIIYRNPRHS
jgi:hypothetical protein